MFQCFLPQPTVVTTVHLRRASGLSPPKQTGHSAQCLFTHTLVSSFHHLTLSFMITAPDVYAVVRCENDTIRTRVFKAEGNPEFNLRAIFYRRYPDTHISVEVYSHYLSLCLSHTLINKHTQLILTCVCRVQLWSRGLLWDSVLGTARLQTALSERSRSHVIDLRGGQFRSGHRGCVYVETSSSVCLTDL